MYILAHEMYILAHEMGILAPKMYILPPKIDILTPKMYILAPKMDKSVPFEKVQPQWQLLYLFFWECTGQKARLILFITLLTEWDLKG